MGAARRHQTISAEIAREAKEHQTIGAEIAREVLPNISADAMDVTETETGFAIRVDAPGIDEKDLEVRAAPRSLCITGKRQESSDQKEGTTIYSERRSKHIFRVQLPAETDPDTVHATVSDGLVEIKLLKVGLSKKVPLAKGAAV